MKSKYAVLLALVAGSANRVSSVGIAASKYFHAEISSAARLRCGLDCIPGGLLRNAFAFSITVLLLAACGGSSDDHPAAPSAEVGNPAFGDAAFLPQDGRAFIPNLFETPNESGFAATFSKAGVVDRTGPFFQNLGINGRSCSSCHIHGEGWSITPRGVQARFDATAGTDPIFRLVDGSNSPLADVSTIDARRSAYSMLLNKGLIRVGIGIPQDAEFELAAVDDPYGFASAKELSLFRRPLPTTNLGFLSAVMWDGRETISDPASTECLFETTDCFAPLHFTLANQSNTATIDHAEAPLPLNDHQRAAIVAFQMDLFTAQVVDHEAGRLSINGAHGGPAALTQQEYYFGINDTIVGDYRTQAPFTPVAMTLFDSWINAHPDATIADATAREQVVAAQRAVARGQQLFNTRPIQIRGVRGLNDALGVDTIAGTCTTCHNSPNVGNHSVPLPLDIGVTDASRRTPDMPLYTFRHKTTGETVQTTDPGRALITGNWRDMARFKGPILRGLAGRAPYFHNGLAKDLEEAVEFYDTRFAMGLSVQEKADLVAFLRTL
jgi:cytochrome c peroxidase